MDKQIARDTQTAFDNYIKDSEQSGRAIKAMTLQVTRDTVLRKLGYYVCTNGRLVKFGGPAFLAEMKRLKRIVNGK